MKNAIFTLTVFMTALLTGLPAQAQVSFGNATKFNEDWLFRLTDDSTIVNPAFNDSEWRKLSFDFLASLFLSFCFIKLVRYADHNCEGGKLPVPVHILGEELTACGTIPDLSRRLSVIRSRNISMSCVFQNLAGLQNRYPQNLWQEIIGNCDAQLFLGCTDQLTAEFISARTGLASVAVSSKSKQLGTWRISNYTPEFRETSGVGKRPVLTPDEVLRLPLDQALIINLSDMNSGCSTFNLSMYFILRSLPSATFATRFVIHATDKVSEPFQIFVCLHRSVMILNFFPYNL